MPGSPATSPNFGANRYANADFADFAGQVNQVTDTFDAAALKSGGAGSLASLSVTGAGTALSVTNAASVGGLLTPAADVTLDAGSGTRGQTVTLTGRSGGTVVNATLAVTSAGALTVTSGTSSLVGATSGGTAFTATTTSFNLPSGSQYQINGAQLSLSNLSNSTTGSGAVVLSASPALSGTVSGALTFSGAMTLSAAGTALTVNNNATISGTSTLTGLVTAAADLTLDAGSGTRAQTLTLTGRSTGTAVSSTLAVTSAGALTVTSGTSSLVGATSGGTAFTATTTTFNIPSGSVYQIAGAQISASNLSNGVTGSGSVVLAAGPTLTGTTTMATAAVTTFSGTPNFSGNATGQTQAASDNSTKLATTAYADRAGGTHMRVTADVSGTTAFNVTGLSFAIGANEIWTAEFFISTLTSAGSGGFDVGFTGPASPTNVHIQVASILNPGANDAALSAFSSFTTVAFGIGVVIIGICVENGANAGTVQLQVQQHTPTNSFTVKRGSFGNARKVT